MIVIDYGVGNLLSVCRGLEHSGATVELTGDPARILSGSRVVLPGVGAFGNAMKALHEQDLVSVVREVAARGTPLLGICLGMQLLFDESEEFGQTAGLGLIPGRVSPILNVSARGESLKVPHIGWNRIECAERSAWTNDLLTDNAPGDAMYFLHSFMAVPSNERYRVADCYYGGHRISSVVSKDNVFGCQFHPEKSGELGLKILRRFLHL